MNIKNIKLIIKTLVMTTIISLSMVNMAFAHDNIKTIQDFCNKYGIEYNGKVDNENKRFYEVSAKSGKEKGDTIVNYSNGSWYIYNCSTNNYIFKPLESDKELKFDKIDDLRDCNSLYEKIKNYNYLKNFQQGIGEHSNNIYSDDLLSNEKLEDYSKKWLKDNYNLTLDVPVYFWYIEQNKNDLHSYIGGMVYNSVDETPMGIKIDKNYCIEKMNIKIEKILIHELTHYALNHLNKQYTDDSDEFKKECTKNGGNTNDGELGILHSHLKCTIK